MKKYLLILAFVFITTDAHASTFLQVGDTISGVEYVDILKTTVKREFSIYVVADWGMELQFKGDTSLGRATIFIPYAEETQKELEDAVSKAIEWSGVAKKNSADVRKRLGCFGVGDQGPYCINEGRAIFKNQMGLEFISSNNGKFIRLHISIIDFENQFIKANILIDETGMRKLLANIKKIDATVKKALEASEKEELFK